MTSALSFMVLVSVLSVLLAQVWAQDFEYSNEYDDVRPHLVYPDEPRLDKRLGQAAQEFGQRMKSAWESMVDTFSNYFDELKNLFTTDQQDSYPNGNGQADN